MSQIEPALPQAVQAYSENFVPELGNEEHQKILSKLEDMFNVCARNRAPFDKQWYLNLAFYFGRQYVDWVGGPHIFENMRLWEPPAPSWRVRLVSNKIRPVIRTELAKLTKEQYQSFVVPDSADEDDVAIADAADKISRNYLEIGGFNKERRKATFWMLLCGSGFIKTYWDDTAIDPYEVQGKICIDSKVPFHLYAPDLQEEEVEAQPFMIEASVKDVDWVETTFGVRVNSDSTVSGPVLEQRMLNAMGIGNLKSTKEKVLVKEIWIKPHKMFPEGAFVMWGGGQLLYGFKSWPNDDPNKLYPYAKMDHIATGRFYADSVINDLIPLQRELNRTRSQIIEAKNRMAKPQIMATMGSLDTNKLTSEPGLVILVKPGFQMPTPLPLTSLPGYVIQEIDRNQKDIDDISGQHEITQGRTPPGIEAASAIAFLQEEQDTRLYPTVASIEEAIEKTGRLMLNLVHQYWDAERVLTLTGQDGIYEAYTFKGTDIKGNSQYKIESGSTMPTTRAGRQAFIMELFDKGMIDQQKALKYLHMVDTNRIFEEVQVSQRQAQREHWYMRQGQPVQVNDWDDTFVHYEEHTKYMRTQAYESLPPEIKAFYIQHLQETITQIQTMGQFPGLSMAPGTIPPQQGNEQAA